MDYSKITDEEINRFLTKLVKLPKEERQNYYYNNLNIVRAYLTKIGVNPIYFEMAAVNERIREAILKYAKDGRYTFFSRDGIYIDGGEKKVFGIIRANDILDIKKSSGIELVNYYIVPLIQNILNKGIEVHSQEKTKIGLFSKSKVNRFFPKGNLLFLDENTFIVESADKVGKQEIAMVKIDQYANNCSIRMVDEFGIVNYEDQMWSFGKDNYEKWLQRFYWFRCYNSENKSVIRKAEISRASGQERTKMISFEDDGDPSTLDLNSWKHKKNHFITLFEKYPKYVEWFYQRFEHPISLLDMIYQEQESDFLHEVQAHKQSIERAERRKESGQADLDGKVRAIIHSINSRPELIKAIQIRNLKNNLNQKVEEIQNLAKQARIKQVIQSSINKAIEIELEEEDTEPDIDVGEEEKAFDETRELYKRTKEVEQVNLKALMVILHTRHELIRGISRLTLKESTYDDITNLLNGDIELIHQANKIVSEAVDNVMWLSEEQAVAQMGTDSSLRGYSAEFENIFKEE